MSTPAKPAAETKTSTQTALGAPTMLESLQASRISSGKPPLRTESRGPNDGEQSQITTRELNQNASPVRTESGGEPGRRIQQPISEEQDTGKDKGKIQQAHSSLGRRLFGEKFEARQTARREREQSEKDKGKKPKKPAEGEGGEGEGLAGAGKKTVEVTRAPKQSGFTREDVEAIAAGAASAAVQAVAPKEEKPDKEEIEEASLKALDDEDRYSHSVAKYMAETQPDKYRDLPDQIVEMGKHKKEYRDEWLKEHPGKKFDWDDQEHEAFLQQVTPDFNSRDFEDGRIELRASAIADKRIEKTEQRIKDVEATAIEASLKEVVEVETGAAIKDFEKEFGSVGEYDLTTKEGRIAAASENPEFGRIAARTSVVLEKAMTELTKLYGSKGTYRLDPKNELHVQMANVVDEEEARFARNPADKKKDDQGRMFVTRADWKKMTDAQRNRHWTIGRDQAIWIVKKAIIDGAIEERDQELNRLESIFKKRGLEFDRDSFLKPVSGSGSNRNGEGEGGGDGDSRGDGGGDQRPPENSGSERVDTTIAGIQQENKKFAKIAMKRLFNRDTDKS